MDRKRSSSLFLEIPNECRKRQKLISSSSFLAEIGGSSSENTAATHYESDLEIAFDQQSDLIPQSSISDGSGAVARLVYPNLEENADVPANSSSSPEESDDIEFNTLFHWVQSNSTDPNAYNDKRCYSIKEANLLRETDVDYLQDLQRKFNCIVSDFLAKGMLPMEETYRMIFEAVMTNDMEAIPMRTNDGYRVERVAGWTEDEWAKRLQEYSPVSDPSECPITCPLRRGIQQLPDPVLPDSENVSQIERLGAHLKVYGKINKWQTRILHLEPGTFGTKLSARMMVVDLIYMSGVVLHGSQQCIEFTALSYTWGAAVFPRMLTINGVAFYITENLFAFLQRYRENDNGVYLWIDALCINQLDLNEKSMQVRNMLTIYEKASNVIVWLGEEGRFTKLAIEIFRWAYSNTTHDRELEYERLPEYWTLGTQNNQNQCWHSAVCAQSFPLVMQGVEDLCSRDWIRRIWIKQEIWAANNIDVYCGSTMLSWDEFMSMSRLRLQSKLTNIAVPKVPPEHVTCLNHLWRRKEMIRRADSDKQQKRNQGTCDLLVLLDQSRSCLFTDPHDQIYALLGMTSVPRQDPRYRDVPALEISIDYQASIPNVFSELAMSIMHLTGPHTILAAAPRAANTVSISLPSWVPDFRNGHHCEFQGHLLKFDPDLYTSPGYYGKYDKARVPLEMKRRALLERFKRLNGNLQTDELMLEGWNIGRLTEEPAFVSTLWQVCLTPDSRDPRRPPPLRTTREDLEQQQQLKHKDVLKAMNFELHSWFTDRYYREGKDDSLFHSPLAMVVIYSERFGILAVPVNARGGDVLVIIPLLATPLVLRTIPGKPGSFHFVGCAWFYFKRRETDAFNNFNYSDEGWKAMRQVLDDIRLAPEPPDLQAQPCLERLETFVIK